MSNMHGLVGNPGILDISPTTGTTNPAPTDTRMSLILSVNPLGAPLIAGSPVRDRDVFAMHMGNLSYPCEAEERELPEGNT